MAEKKHEADDGKSQKNQNQAIVDSLAERIATIN